jgi:hypothetical protein
MMHIQLVAVVLLGCIGLISGKSDVIDLSELRVNRTTGCKEQCNNSSNASCEDSCIASISTLMDPSPNDPNSPSIRGGSITVPWDYPLVKQCDDRWGNDLMGNKTICAVGCLMSSTSMGIAGVKINIDGNPSNPGTLNSWLKANDGYQNNNLIEGAVPKIDPSRISWPADAMHTTNDLSYETVSQYIKDGRIVIGNVMSGGHFVLLTGYSTDGDTFMVNDSGFNTLSYSYSTDIVGYRIFDMNRN